MNKMDKMNEMEIMLSDATTMTMRDEEWCPIVGESGPVHEPECEANGCLGVTRRCSKRVCQVYPCKIGISIQNRPPPTMYETA